MLESEYQGDLIKLLERELFPGCVVLKNDANLRPGIPDLSIFYNNKWATLEVKTHEKAKIQANQPWYVETMNNMSFSRFIYPEVQDQVLAELADFFRS